MSLARNEIRNRVESYVLNANDGVTARTGGNIELHATEDATIDAFSVAASLAVGVGGTFGGGISGAGAEATNVIVNGVNAYVQDSRVAGGADVILDASDDSSITATIVAASAGVGAGGTGGVGASIGAAVAHNFVGFNADGTDALSEVKAYIQDSSVSTPGQLKQSAKSTQKIDAIVIAGSAAIGAGGTAGLAASGAGVYAENLIGVNVKSYIDGDGDSGIQAGDVLITADDSAAISAIAGAASLAAALGGTVGASVSVGIALADNEIGNVVEAYIINADGGSTVPTGAAQGVTSRTGDIMVEATSQGQALPSFTLGPDLSIDDLNDAA